MIPMGARVPRRGNAFSRGLGRLVLRLLGWRIEGELPDAPRMVVIGAPHTSNMDGFIGITTLIALGLDARTMIKDSAFKGLLGRFLRWAGAMPIRRGSRDGVIEQCVAAFAERPSLWLLIAPEGTRRSGAQWKRGFHYIAQGAGVPILPVAANYRDRVVRFGDPMPATADYAADLDAVLAYFHRYGVARHPERLSQPLCVLAGQTWVPRNPREPPAP